MIELYTKPSCHHCQRAKQILRAQELVFYVHEIGKDITRDEVILKFPTAKTLPVIVVNGDMLGGVDDLHRLVVSGGIKHLLNDEDHKEVDNG